MKKIKWLHKLFNLRVLVSCALMITLSFTQPALAAYQPPTDLKSPTVYTDSSGVRGGCKASGGRLLTILAPTTHVGQTTLSHPTFAWLVPDEQPTPMEFTLYEFDANADPTQLAYKHELQSSPGIMKLSLPQQLPGLTVGKRYLWQIETLCNRNHPSRNLLARAEIEVVQMPRTLKTALSDRREYSQKATLYAEAGIWYDALREALSSSANEQLLIAASLLEDLAKL